ncbi:hypothetical protein K443DRAFT_372877, partial [Laccaria amethystina LaAM-08-1]
LKWLARRVNVTTSSKVRCQSTRYTLTLSRALVPGNIGGNVMWMQHARYRGFHALGGGSRFFVTESAAVNDRRYPRRNFQFPNLLDISAAFIRDFLPGSKLSCTSASCLQISYE